MLSTLLSLSLTPQIVPAVSFADHPGVLYAPARAVAQRFGLKLDYDAASDLAFLDTLPIGRESSLGTGERLVRLTALRLLGAEVEVDKGQGTATLDGKTITVRLGKKSAELDQRRQRLVAKQGDLVVLDTRVSTGKYRGSTPTGRFVVGSDKDAYHASSKYENAPMPWAVRIRGPVFIHGHRHVPEYPASHGCVRAPMPAAEWFFKWVEPGTPFTIKGSWVGKGS